MIRVVGGKVLIAEIQRQARLCEKHLWRAYVCEGTGSKFCHELLAGGASRKAFEAIDKLSAAGAFA